MNFKNPHSKKKGGGGGERVKFCSKKFSVIFTFPVIFEQQRHFRTLQKTFLISANYSLNVIQSVSVSTLCHSIGLYVCSMSLFVCMTSNQSTSKKPSHMLDLNKVTSCCIKHTARSLLD